MSVLVGLLYFDIGLCQSSVQNRVGALFFIMTNQGFAMMASLNVFLEERNLFNRERASGCYRTSTYFFGKLLIELPLLLFYPILFASISYWMIGLQPTATCFFSFTLTLVLFATVASSLFMLLGAISPNIAIAQVLCPVVLVIFMIFGGLFVNTVSLPPFPLSVSLLTGFQDSIPVYFQWITYVSFFNWGYQALCYIEFNGFGNPLEFPCNCESDQTVCFHPEYPTPVTMYSFTVGADSNTVRGDERKPRAGAPRLRRHSGVGGLGHHPQYGYCVPWVGLLCAEVPLQGETLSQSCGPMVAPQCNSLFYEPCAGLYHQALQHT